MKNFNYYKYSKVLVLTAHPDDLELSCGGTVKKFADESIQVDNAILCSDVPHARWVEDSSRILEYNPIFFYYRDHHPTTTVVEHLEKKLKVSTYDLIITHWSEDWHQDHRFCHDIANTLRRKQPIDVWYMNAYPYCHKYKSFERNLYVNISDQLDDKVKAISCYRNVPDEWADCTTYMSKLNGAFVGVQDAEVFKVDTLLYS